MSNVMMLCEYNGDKVVDIEFTVESCRKYVEEVNEKNSDWVDKDVDNFGDWEGKDDDDEDDMGKCVRLVSKEVNDKLIVVMYSMYCIESGWISVGVKFVLTK